METARLRDPFGLTGTILEGRFRVEHQVAEGGFGVVYRATQVALERSVALKVLKMPPELEAAAGEQFHQRFAAEAKTIARMSHPHIVGVHDFGISVMPTGREAPWMALEWLSGRTLEETLRERRGQGGQSPGQALALLRPAFQACAYAHGLGIAHRDIKPANLMLVGGVLRVLDFGIAKVSTGDDGPNGTRAMTTGMRICSPGYAAPEQIAFGRSGPWTDVHALGLLVTEVLTDAPPYAAEDVQPGMQLFEEVKSTQRPTPGRKGRDVGPWEDVLAKALALSPGERWPGAGEFLAALEQSVGVADIVAEGSLKVGSNTRIGVEAGHTVRFQTRAGASGPPSRPRGPDTVVAPEPAAGDDTTPEPATAAAPEPRTPRASVADQIGSWLARIMGIVGAAVGIFTMVNAFVLPRFRTPKPTPAKTEPTPSRRIAEPERDAGVPSGGGPTPPPTSPKHKKRKPQL